MHLVYAVIDTIVKYGVEVFPQPTGEILIGVDDHFFEVAMEKRDDTDTRRIRYIKKAWCDS